MSFNDVTLDYNLMPALRNLITGKDNQTHDIIRVAIAVVGLLFPVMIVWGLGMVTWAFAVGKIFDLEAPYRGISFLITAFGLFLGGSAGAIYWKRTTEPDGVTSETQSITTGKQEADNTTNIIVK